MSCVAASIRKVNKEIKAIDKDIEDAAANVLSPPDQRLESYWVDREKSLRDEKAALRAEKISQRAERVALVHKDTALINE